MLVKDWNEERETGNRKLLFCSSFVMLHNFYDFTVFCFIITKFPIVNSSACPERLFSCREVSDV